VKCSQFCTAERKYQAGTYAATGEDSRREKEGPGSTDTAWPNDAA
jgi:hypothetical protein